MARRWDGERDVGEMPRFLPGDLIVADPKNGNVATPIYDHSIISWLQKSEWAMIVSQFRYGPYPMVTVLTNTSMIGHVYEVEIKKII